MKGLRRSAICSCTWWASYSLFIYYVLYRTNVFESGLGNLIYGNNGRRFPGSIMMFVIWYLFTANLIKRTLLPCHEALICKQIAEKTTRLYILSTESGGHFLLWPRSSTMRINGERGIYEYPDILPDELKDSPVHIRYLRRSHLVLQISAAESTEKSPEPAENRTPPRSLSQSRPKMKHKRRRTLAHKR